MPLPADPSPALKDYAHPERLVTADWLSAHLGTKGLAIVESDEDVLLYDIGHIPGAVKIDWHTDLNDPHVRDYITGEQFAELMNRKGISRDDTVVIYGDKSNWWAAYALWVFTLFGHPDVRLLDGGRDLWISDGRDTTLDVPTKTTTGYPVVERNDARHPRLQGRCAWLPWPFDADRRALARRSTPASAPTCPTIPRRARCAAGTSRPRCRCRGPRPPTTAAGSAAAPNSRTSTPSSSRATTIIAYCRIGERSSHTWFVLTHLLGIPGVRNYDGSWTEWGNTVRVPIVAGEDPGRARRAMSMPAPWPRWCRTSPRSRARTSCTLLLEFANDLPPLPADLEEAAMEPVPECQSPLFLHVDAADRGHVRLYFSAPAEAPTTRGFASILAAGLDGQSAADILAVPDDFYAELGLAALISPLRLRGMSAMLTRIKRRLREAG